MVINETFLKNAGLNTGIESDLQFVVLDTASNEVIHSHYNANHSKSTGSIQSILEMNMLMTKSLAIINPGLVFSPDFPDYLLSEDDPKYMETIPMITEALYKVMPHFRDDLYKRDYGHNSTCMSGVIYHINHTNSTSGFYEEVFYDPKNDHQVCSQDKVLYPAPHITWSIVRQEPGTVSGTPFRGTQEIKPRQRDLVLVFDKEYKSILETHSDNKFIEKGDKLYKYIKVQGQFMDNLVQYNMWCRSHWEVEELTDWFQRRYMLPYTGMFREAGVNNLYFNRRVRDDTMLQMKTRYHLRSILYYVRTEHIYNETIMPITRIDVDIDTLATTNEFTINTELANYYDRIVDRWHLNK